MVLATNRETADMAHRLGARRVESLPDTALLPETVPRSLPSHRRPVRPRILWVGQNIPRKGLSLAIAAANDLQRTTDAELAVAGPSPIAGTEGVTWLGKVPFNEMPKLYGSADVFLFTSLREAMGSQVIEAAGQGLPIVALDLHGVSTFVPNDASIKISLSDPAETVSALSRALRIVLTDQERWQAMSAAAWRFGQEQTLAARATFINNIYDEVSDL